MVDDKKTDGTKTLSTEHKTEKGECVEAEMNRIGKVKAAQKPPEATNNTENEQTKENK